MPLDQRRRPDTQVQKIMLRYRVLPYEEDEDEDVPIMPFRRGPQSYTRSYQRSYSPIRLTKSGAPRITTATYRYNVPVNIRPTTVPVNVTSTSNVTKDNNSSDLEKSVNQFLADMDIRRKGRSLENGLPSSKPVSRVRPSNHYHSKGSTVNTKNTYTVLKTQPITTRSEAGQLFAKDVHDILSRTRKQLILTSPTYRPTTVGNIYTEPRNSDRSSYSTWKAPRSSTGKSSNVYSSSFNSHYKSDKHSTPVKEKSMQSEGPTYEDSHDISEIKDNDDHNLEPDGNVTDEKGNKAEFVRTDSRPDGLEMWEDIDLDDIVEDEEDQEDQWRKDKVADVLEPGKFVGHGFRTEPVRMTAEQGHVTWAKPRGELDIIITKGESGTDFQCEIHTEHKGVRMSQLMSEGEEKVLFSGKNDLESSLFQSNQGHVVLMLEAVCTPFLKKVFSMTYEIVSEDAK